jgi:membrane protease YdiL (CAAX protease family)
VFSKEIETYIVTTILFALWHIGYISSIAFRVETGLANAMIGKVITGLCFGIILGMIRLKTKNSYSTILLHGALNIFGR